LSIQAAPTSLRLMESNWSWLIHELNQFLQWLVNKISAILSWDEVTARLAKPSHVDDLNRNLAALQLMLAGQASRTSGLKTVGLKFEEEQQRLIDEQKLVAETSQEAQEELEAAGLGDMMAQGMMQPGMQPGAAPAGGAPVGGAPAGGGMPAGGAAPPAGGAAPPAGGDPMAGAMQPVDPVSAVIASLPQAGVESVTPQELTQMAETIAQQIFAMQASDRISALRALKQKNPTVHALVKSHLDRMDSSAKRQGKQMAQQAAGAAQQQSMAPPPM